MKVLLEMRPALDGYSGIPQETRLLYRGLAAAEDIELIGLLQSGNLVLEPGLPMRKGRIAAADSLSDEDRINRLSRVVASLQQGPASHRLEHLRKKFLKFAGPLYAAARAALGGTEPLTAFDPRNFEDFIWRGLFAKSLPADDFQTVTRGTYRILRWPMSMVNLIGVATGTLGHAVYPRLDTRGIDVMITETPYPGRPAKGTRLIVRYHDAIPLLMPHTIKDRGYNRALHFHSLRRNAADGAWFACVSEATRRDLISILPSLEPRAVTIPNVISHHYFHELASADRVPEIIWSRKNRTAPHEGGADLDASVHARQPLRYLLVVGTLEPRKNHAAMIDAWELLRAAGHTDLQLICVGPLGWEHQAILDRFSPWLRRGGLHLLHGVPADDLRLLYRHALVTVCPSFGEGFDFAGVESMRSGGVVAASDIPAHKEVYADAAEYFNPYAPADIAMVVGRLLASEAVGRRDDLRNRGALVSARYLPEAIMPRWMELLRGMSDRRPANETGAPYTWSHLSKRGK